MTSVLPEPSSADLQALAHYAACFSRLHTARGPRYPAETHHQAPHKPLLLLSVIDLFTEGSIQKHQIQVTPELGEIFTGYWACIMPSGQRGNLALPFFHLRSDGFWHLHAKPGKQDVVEHGGQIRSLSQLDDLVAYAYLDPDLVRLMQDDQASTHGLKFGLGIW